MSVYRPANSRIWLYDFQNRGVRFHGSTGQTTRRAAEAVERQRRLEAATGVFGQVGQMTLDVAGGRWWAEVGIHRGDAKDVERRLTALIALMGPGTVLSDINQATIATAIQKRRGIGTKRSKAKDAKVYLPSNATVNRDVIETLRPVLKRAMTHWTPKGSPHGLSVIDWRELRLREPTAQSRLYPTAERAKWLEACDPDVRLALELLLTYGLRFGELFFAPDQLNTDPERPTLTLQKGRKKDVLLEVPLRRDHARELAARASRARDAKLDHLWFRQKGFDAKGRERLVEITYSGLEYWISKAADQAGVSGGRRIHGARHHAGSTILRKTKNLKAVQALLGHATIQSSQRYAHVQTDELRAALEGPEGEQDFGSMSGLLARNVPNEPDLFRNGEGEDQPLKASKAQ